MAEELIQHFLIDLDSIPRDIPLVERVVSDLFLLSKNSPIEIRGKTETPIAIYIFLRAKLVTPEIVYREKEGGDVYIIYSNLEDGTFVRPASVSYPIIWPENENVTFTEYMSDLKREVDLSLIWDKAEGDGENRRKSFMKEIYKIDLSVPVRISNEVPILPLLLAINWLSRTKAGLFYEGAKLC